MRKDQHAPQLLLSGKLLWRPRARWLELPDRGNVAVGLWVKVGHVIAFPVAGAALNAISAEYLEKPLILGVLDRFFTEGYEMTRILKTKEKGT